MVQRCAHSTLQAAVLEMRGGIPRFCSACWPPHLPLAAGKSVMSQRGLKTTSSLPSG